MDKFTGRSRGFGFVEMSDADGQKAIDALNGQDIDGKTIAVSVAKPREDRPKKSFNRGGGGGGGFKRRDNDRDGGYGKKDFNRW
jgi:RNA recognition motif-containing protein